MQHEALAKLQVTDSPGRTTQTSSDEGGVCLDEEATKDLRVGGGGSRIGEFARAGSEEQDTICFLVTFSHIPSPEGGTSGVVAIGGDHYTTSAVETAGGEHWWPNVKHIGHEMGRHSYSTLMGQISSLSITSTESGNIWVALTSIQILTNEIILIYFV